MDGLAPASFSCKPLAAKLSLADGMRDAFRALLDVKVADINGTGP
jgi:hypothetical protein